MWRGRDIIININRSNFYLKAVKDFLVPPVYYKSIRGIVHNSLIFN
jgi:hypothetical protein